MEKNKEQDINLEKLNKLVGLLDIDNEKLVQRFIDERGFRIKLLDLVSEFEHHMVYSYIQFFTRCINKIWAKVSTEGDFTHYNEYLTIILDIIINYEYKKMAPKLFQITAEALDNVFGYIVKEVDVLSYGKSWVASKTWHNEKEKIPREMINQLYDYSTENSLFNLSIFTSKLKL